MRQGKNYRGYQIKSVKEMFEYQVTAIREKPYDVVIVRSASLIDATKEVEAEIDTKLDQQKGKEK